MSTAPSNIYSLLPAVFRTRDAKSGQLQALFQVLESQYGIVHENVLQLYDDQFIETCAPWVIPYIGQLLGFDPVYTASLTSPDSRAEVANTIGYRRRKGTLVALEQVTQDVSGRATLAVEEFRHLITTLSLRDVRPCHHATADLRKGRALESVEGPFTRLNRTVDVRRIAPRNRVVQSPDPTPLEIALHGPGRYNIPDVAVWMWRWKSWLVTQAPAFSIGSGGYFFSALGAPNRLFQSPVPETRPFARLTTENDVPEPISRTRFADNIGSFYPGSMELVADGISVPASQIVCANLEEDVNGKVCRVKPGKIAIDPVLGRIQYAADLKLPIHLRVTYNYGAPAPMGGGPYDRSSCISDPTTKSGGFVAVVGTIAYPSLESAVAAWNLLPPASMGTIVLPNFESYAINLTGARAIQIPSESRLLIASAEHSNAGSPPLWTNSWTTLNGDIEVVAPPAPLGPDGLALPVGEVQISGIRLCGELRLLGDASSVQVSDSTFVPGRRIDRHGQPTHPGEPSVSGTAISANLCLIRVVSGPIALPSSCSVRVVASIVDAGTPYCPAYANQNLSGPGAELHIEDSTVIGRVWAQAIRLASNTIFHAKLGLSDPWKAPVWAQRRQVGCVRFCWLPSNSLVPRRYECLPTDSDQTAIEPRFVTKRFGEPSYCLLSGDTPLAIWKGADNGSQMGAYLQIQETEAVANIQIRSMEFLPANLERGVFLVPSRPEREPIPDIGAYGYGTAPRRCQGQETTDHVPAGIGIGLI